MDSTNYYRTYPLVQQDFVIALSRTVNVMASTGVQLFIPSVLAFARDDDGSFESILLPFFLRIGHRRNAFCSDDLGSIRGLRRARDG